MRQSQFPRLQARSCERCYPAQVVLHLENDCFGYCGGGTAHHTGRNLLLCLSLVLFGKDELFL